MLGQNLEVSWVRLRCLGELDSGLIAVTFDQQIGNCYAYGIFETERVEDTQPAIFITLGLS